MKVMRITLENRENFKFFSELELILVKTTAQPMKKNLPISRRGFVKNTSLTALGLGLAGSTALTARPTKVKNKLPQWKGFNLLDFFSPDPSRSRRGTSEEYLQWMADWGFDFVRIPMAYPYYLDIDRSKNITPDDVYKIDENVFLAWFGDVLDILSTNGIGFAIWEFAGSFGVLDSDREDITYEDWYGHKLDRKMLNLLTKK